MNKPLSFGPVAPYYDELMSRVPYDMWVGYYQLLQAHIGVEHRDLLDVCCGTGTVAELLTLEDYLVTGFDLSPEMISEAKKKAEEKNLTIRYLVCNACELDLGCTFDGAYSFFDSLNYITDLGQLRLAINRIGAHLETGGSFIFDLNTDYAFEQKMFDQTERSKRAKLHYDWKGEYDPESRMIEVRMSFKKGSERFSEVHIQRAHSIDEVKDALESAGFDEIYCWESYTLEPPGKSSDRIHFGALKGK